MDSPTLASDFENFKNCAEQAPEGTYDQAKRLNQVLGEVCDSLMKEIRALGLRADACDSIFRVETALYQYVRESNVGDSLFPMAEGFGSAMSSPAELRERVLVDAANLRDFVHGRHTR